MQRWFEMLGIPVWWPVSRRLRRSAMDVPPEVLPGRVGRAIDGAEMTISEEGELLVRGPNVFRGYWQRRTLQTPLEGWLHQRPGELENGPGGASSILNWDVGAWRQSRSNVSSWRRLRASSRRCWSTSVGRS